MNQKDRVIQYLKDFGSITPMEAFSDLGITKLATRVSELKTEGYQFEQEYASSFNRYGQKCHYMRYKLKEVSNG